MRTAAATGAGWVAKDSFAELRREKFDLAVLFQNAFEAAWLAWRAGIPERIGYARDGRGPLLTKAVRVPKEGEIPRHESHYYLELLRRAGWIESRGEIAPIRLQIAESAREAAESTLLRAGARRGAWRCAIAPGASYGAAKCWPPERFASLADRLISECGADVIFFGTSGEKEIAARICSAMKSRAISLAGQTSMRDLAALFSVCSVFIGNDSGAMHVAAAAGLPVIGIFGSTDPEGTAPVTQQFTLIREAVSCSPCFLRRCPVDHRCMTRITSIPFSLPRNTFSEREKFSVPGAARMSESRISSKGRFSGSRRHDLRGNGLRQPRRPSADFSICGGGDPPAERSAKFPLSS